MSRLHVEQVIHAAPGAPGSLHEGPVPIDSVALVDFDIDRVSRLVLASERSLALVNRRALAVTLANIQPDPGQALPPAPPFAEAVAIAREDGRLIERIRLFLATHPRAIEELTPELTRTLVRIFDPSGRTARLISARSPILHFAVTGAAIVGALTLLTSAGLLVGTVAQRLSHAPVGAKPAAHVARGLSPEALSRLPGAPASENAAPARSVASASAAPAATAAPARPAASETRARETVVASVARTAPPVAAPVSRVATTPQTRPATVAKAAAPVDTASAANANALPGGAAATPVAPPAAATANVAESTPAVRATAAGAVSAAATTPVAAGASEAGAPADPGRDAAARTFVVRNIMTVDPSARVEWMHAARNATTETIRIEALVRTDSASSVVHYTLHDDGTGFTLVDKVSVPNP